MLTAKVADTDVGEKCIPEFPCGLPGLRYHLSTPGNKKVGICNLAAGPISRTDTERSSVSITILVPKCEYFPNPRTLRGRVLETCVAKHIPFGDYSTVFLELTRQLPQELATCPTLEISGVQQTIFSIPAEA